LAKKVNKKHKSKPPVKKKAKSASKSKKVIKKEKPNTKIELKQIV
jgi:hypothetical protein